MWQELYELATKQGYKLIFSAGPGEREQALISDLKKQEPTITVLPPVNDLGLFLAILNQAEVVIAGDTGPLQFAAGLGVKIIGLLGVENSILQTAPNYQENQLVQAKPCTCVGELANHQTCQNKNSCMNTILPSDVLSLLLTITPPTFSKKIT
jgi:ADP-heptose:LPS heptosyltransferase